MGREQGRWGAGGDQKGPDCSELCAHAESLEMALKKKNKGKNLGRVQNRKNLTFDKDCRSFYMEVGLVRAKWKWEECCPGV